MPLPKTDDERLETMADEQVTEQQPTTQEATPAPQTNETPAMPGDEELAKAMEKFDALYAVGDRPSGSTATDVPEKTEEADSGQPEGQDKQQQRDSGKEGQGSAPPVDVSVVARAVQAGFTPDEINSFVENPKALEAAVTVAERRLKAVPDAQKEPPAEDEDDKFLKSLESKMVDWDDGLKEVVKAIYDRAGAKVKSAEEKAAQVLEAQQRLEGEARRRAQIEKTREFDSFLGSIGNEWSEVYGEGPTEKLDTKSPEFQTRNEVCLDAEAFMIGRHVQGRQVPDIREAWRKAHAMYNEERLTKHATQRVIQFSRDNQGRFVSQPTRRDASDARSPEDRATQEVAAKLRALGA